MRPPPAVSLACVGILALLSACKKEREDAPRVPTSGYMVNTGNGSRDGGTDAGRDRGNEDAGMFPLATECDNVRSAVEYGEDPGTNRYANAVAEPEDFSVSRAEATWESTCARPTIRISLSDGKCPRGAGHEVQFFFDAAAVDSDAITVGQNVVVGEEEDRAIRIRYTRPRGLTPSGVWGTCGPATEGGVTIRDPRIGTDASSRFEALFQVILPACDGSDNAVQQLLGSFDVRLRRSLDDACPE